jgi:iron complex transport system substrate-binding protein
MKKILCFVLALLFFVTLLPNTSVTASDVTITAEINGKPLAFTDAVPYEDNGVLMVPLRMLCEQTGIFVTQDPTDKSIRVQDGYDYYILANGRRTVYTKDGYFSMKRPAVIKNGRTYVSLDFFERLEGLTFTYEKNKLSVKMPYYRNDFCKVFNIEYLENGLKLLTDTNGRKLLLVDGKTKIPVKYLFDKSIEIITVPVSRVVLFSTSYVGILDVIGETDSVIGTTTPAQDWFIEDFKKGHQDGTMTFIGDNSAVDFEALKKLKPDLAILYDDNWDTPKIVEKLEEFGIRYVICTDWLEEDPFSRLEIGSLVSAFYNKEMMASVYTNGAVAKIEVIKSRYEGKEKPKVVWGNIVPFGGTGMYVPDKGSYIAKWIEMAGGDYVFSDVGTGLGGSVMIDPEEFYRRAKDADIFIYSGFVTTYTPEISVRWMIDQMDILKNLKSVKNGRVWNYAPSWYQVAPYTQNIIEDMSAIFYPDIYEGYQIKYLSKMPQSMKN